MKTYVEKALRLFFGDAQPHLTDEDAALRAQQSARLLEDPAFLATMEDTRAELIMQWLNTSHDDTAKRETFYHRLKAIDTLENRVRGQIPLTTNNGEENEH